MLIALEQHCVIVWLAMPDEQGLSAWIVVSACGWPILTRAVRNGMPSCVLWNRASSSAYVADSMEFLTMMLSMHTAQLYGGGVDVREGVTYVLVGRSLRKKVTLTRMRACASERYETSLSMCKYMQLEI
jgi:hypothetical protein